MCEVVSVQLEWKYQPLDLLEVPVNFCYQGIDLAIENGVAAAKIEPAFFHSNESLRTDLTRQIESCLQSVQLMTHRRYELSKPSRTDVRADGKSNIFVESESARIICSAWPADIIVQDKNGVIISDTKQNRLNKQASFADLISRHIKTDTTLQQMLKSYDQAVNDPENELVHLYEIRDALTAKFGKSAKAIKTLGIKTQWHELGGIANDLPLNQGRHRGKSAGQLRDAERAELIKARELAFLFIEKYLRYLDSENEAG